MTELAFVLGGGRSAQGIDVPRLRKLGPVWGVNEAAFKVECDAFFTIDRNWVWEDEVQKQIRALRCPIHICRKARPDWPDFPGAISWSRVLGPPNFDVGKCSTGKGGAARSGLSVLNVLAKYGFDRIILIGYDMHDGQYDYWFSNYVHPCPNVKEVIENFSYHAPYYEQRGITILNANPTSALNCFKKITHEEAYDG